MMLKITQLEMEGEAALTKIHKLKEVAFSKIVMLKKEKQAATSKIEELEKEKEYAARKIALLEKELKTKEYIFGQYKNAQIQKEKKLRTFGKIWLIFTKMFGKRRT
ncbi:hypothetical protein A4A49_54311 [Nicotiana attenuata]|uniref:Uncharacterized protein n=1 Tax=Nicotiana attenuata TaxID=49451 RepID=A0A1J6KIK2_NICAT|nr:hypothetical protein A4A49_54311 [Nicotiana attenuata]